MFHLRDALSTPLTVRVERKIYANSVCRRVVLTARVCMARVMTSTEHRQQLVQRVAVPDGHAAFSRCDADCMDSLLLLQQSFAPLTPITVSPVHVLGTIFQ